MEVEIAFFTAEEHIIVPVPTIAGTTRHNNTPMISKGERVVWMRWVLDLFSKFGTCFVDIEITVHTA